MHTHSHKKLYDKLNLPKGVREVLVGFGLKRNWLVKY